MNFWEGALLGLVQGLTEFLPVSSSGHLVLAHHVMGLNEPSLFIEVLLHAGTLVAIFVVFWKDLYALGAGGLGGAAGILKGGMRKTWAGNDSFRLLVFLILGTIPVGLVGLVAKDHVESLGKYPWIVGCILLVNALMLYRSRPLEPGEVDLKSITLRLVLIVGTAQILALLPGISRSGTTIVAALLIGVGRDAAGRLSFLLAVPAILGATILELINVFEKGTQGESWGPVLLGTAVATVSGYLALLLLLKLVRKGRLFVFAPYCLLLGVAAIILGLF